MAAWNNDRRLLGVGRIHLNNLSEAQIRYMAVVDSYRRQGIGSAIVAKLEEFARGQQCEHIILNARDEVISFYATLGYEVVAEGSLLFGTVSHSTMKKVL